MSFVADNSVLCLCILTINKYATSQFKTGCIQKFIWNRVVWSLKHFSIETMLGFQANPQKPT